MGETRAGILARLAEGEITAEEASKLLDRIGKDAPNREQEEESRPDDLGLQLETSTPTALQIIEQMGNMRGRDFERLIARLFQLRQHTDVTLTANNDQGADIICRSPDGKKVVVQAKRWKGTVGNSAVQEIIGALHFYDADVAYVVTNSQFTPQAKGLADKAGVILINYTLLAGWIKEAFPQDAAEQVQLGSLPTFAATPLRSTPAKTSAPQSYGHRHRRRQARQVHVPVQEEDHFWPLLVMLIVGIILFCLMM
jgi:hypothetical protein